MPKNLLQKSLKPLQDKAARESTKESAFQPFAHPLAETLLYARSLPIDTTFSPLGYCQDYIPGGKINLIYQFNENNAESRSCSSSGGRASIIDCVPTSSSASNTL
ncbi:MAG: hypothetical protein RID53_28425 [Coleofasciculus sp. B1-GNL1-01]